MCILNNYFDFIGFVVLVEGIHTGDAQLTAKFLDPEFAVSVFFYKIKL
jgi:hypothetical protein